MIVSDDGTWWLHFWVLEAFGFNVTDRPIIILFYSWLKSYVQRAPYHNPYVCHLLVWVCVRVITQQHFRASWKPRWIMEITITHVAMYGWFLTYFLWSVCTGSKRPTEFRSGFIQLSRSTWTIDRCGFLLYSLKSDKFPHIKVDGHYLIRMLVIWDK